MRVTMRNYCAIALAGMVLAGCSERNVLGPEALEPAAGAPDASARQLVCQANVRAGTVSCSDIAPKSPAGINADKIIGGQELHVRLSSSNTAYDLGTQIFSTQVTVQNLLDYTIGTTDGVTTTGVKVFFHDGPTVTSGTGSIAVFNASGVETFTDVDQPFFFYNQILTTFEISSALEWQFLVDPTVNTFQFTVLVSATMPDANAPMHEVTWMGESTAMWNDPANWMGGAMPSSTMSVLIKPDSMFEGNMPMLADNVDLANLRVGQASTINLNSFTANVSGNLDAVGTLMSGTARMTGTGAMLRGNVHALEVAGSAKLQGALKATGAVSISGSLTNNGHAMTIILP